MNKILEKVLETPYIGILITNKFNIIFKNTKVQQLLDITDDIFLQYNDLKHTINKSVDIDLIIYDKVVRVNVSSQQIDDNIVWFFTDISERLSLNENLIFQKNNIEYKLMYDELTELPNEKSAKNEINKLIKNNKIFKLFYIYVSDISLINNTFSTVLGDLILKKVSEILKIKFKNNFIAKVDGNKFLIIFENIKNTKKTINSIININENIEVDSFGLSKISSEIKVSVCEYPKDAKTFEILIMSLNLALQNTIKSKTKFKIFTEDLKIQNLNKITTLNSLKQAISNDEFIHHFQPQIDSRTGELVGLEALVRWNNPEKGLIYPNDFLDIAIEGNLLFDIDKYLVKKVWNVCVDLKTKYNFKKHIAVNITAKQLNRNFDKFLKTFIYNRGKCSEEFKCNQCLSIEITESEMVKDIKSTIKNLNTISSLGIKISMDDFGTGYSSLSNIQNLPINILKIDKSFIDTILANDTKILDIIILIGKTLNLTIVCEGVETKEQVDYLVSKDCYIIQGYYYSKPLPLEEIIEKYVKK